MLASIDRAAVEKARAHVAEIGWLLFDRHLTDAAGGNISVRVGDVVVMSPSYAGAQYHWRLKPEDVLIVDLEGNILEGAGKLSREAGVHLALQNEFYEYGNAVIHAHARNILVFAAMAQSMPPVLEGTQKFGELQIAQYAPSHTDELGVYIANAIRGQEDRIRKQAAGVIGAWHGLFAMGRDLDTTFDAVERMEANAYCILMAQAALGGRDLLAAQREHFNAEYQPFAGRK